MGDYTPKLRRKHLGPLERRLRYLTAAIATGKANSYELAEAGALAVALGELRDILDRRDSVS